MSDKSLEFKLCPKCGSTEYLEDYPAPGTSICAKCGHEIVTITLRETAENFVEHNCIFCGKEGNTDHLLYEDNFRAVYKCKGCEKLDGRLDVAKAGGSGEYLNDGNYSRKAAAIAEKEGSSIYIASKAKEVAKALHEKEKDPEEKCKKHLHHIISQQNENFKAAGVAPESIRDAAWKVKSFINKNGSLTNKQVMNLLYAVMYMTQDALIRSGQIKTANLTERTIQETFSIDRKTLRKWKKVYRESLSPIKLTLNIHKENHLIQDASVELPKDLKSITELKTPYKEKCADSFFGYNILTHRITFHDGSWSDISQKLFDWIGPSLCELDWTLKLPSQK
jgi:hypothetical protein